MSDLLVTLLAKYTGMQNVLRVNLVDATDLFHFESREEYYFLLFSFRHFFVMIFVYRGQIKYGRFKRALARNNGAVICG